MPGIRGLSSAAVAAVLIVVGAHPAPADPPSPWEATSDTGRLGDDIARFTAASPTLDHVNQGLDTVFVSGTSGKPAIASSAGIHDLDVGTTAYNADTGAVRWKSIYDGGLGVDDQLGAFEVNFHNNLIYEMVNSGQDIVTIERSVYDGKLSRSAVYPGATARDSAISPVGGFLGVVGSKGSKFLALTYETGSQNLELEAQPIDGQANSADISDTGSLDATRTLLATGMSNGFGTGGDIYTVAYNYRTHAKLWERSWASPNNKRDEGIVAKAAHVSALGKAVGFVAGRTFTPERGWDIVVTAYDLTTGNPIWGAPVTFNGAASSDDSPMYLAYSDKSSMLYLTGTSERGVPHGQDVMTIAYDAATGQQKAIAYGSGDSSNADDVPTGLIVSKDGKRVFVAANVENLLSTGSRQAALFTYDSRLRPAGSRVVGGPSDDRSAGVALNVAQSRVFLGGSTRTDSGFDHHAASFGLEDFALPKIPTELSFTPESETTGQYSDGASLKVRLLDDTGAPLGSAPVTISLGNQDRPATTGPDGIASATFNLDSAPGTYVAKATYAGDATHVASEVTKDFTISPEDAALAFESTSPTSGQYSDDTTLSIALSDADSGAAIEGRSVTISLAGEDVTTTTGSNGVASADFHLDSAPGTYDAQVSFSGDDYYLGDDATSAFEIKREDSGLSLGVDGNGKSRNLSALLFDQDTRTSGIAGREIAFFSDGKQIGTATTGSTGNAMLPVPPRYRGGAHNYRAEFGGDSFFKPSADGYQTR